MKPALPAPSVWFGPAESLAAQGELREAEPVRRPFAEARKQADAPLEVEDLRKLVNGES